ncbi:mechanosensitive ion channel family protein [Streptomyces jumonjinensis]|uniref:mechanosensitive ion channel family protein n=1 Tax=Streptomyces jumonjinensis TaxID=1945 RepID=UPI0037AAA5A6
MPQPLALSVDFGQGFTDAWSAVVRFIPKFVAFLVILVIGWFIAKLIARVVDRVLRKVGFERLAERSGTANALRGSKYDATGILTKVIYYGLLLIVLQLAFGAFGPNPISAMITAVVAWLPRAIVALVIVVVAMAIARAVRDIVLAALGGVSYGRFLATAVWAFIVALGVIAALGQAGIATAITGPLLAAVLATIAGVVIVGVGGGLIGPMRQRWERWLSRAEEESAGARDSIGAYQRGRADAQAGQPGAGSRTTGARRERRRPGRTDQGPEGRENIDPM